MRCNELINESAFLSLSFCDVMVVRERREKRSDDDDGEPEPRNG
jgi:hypothetical protein